SEVINTTEKLFGPMLHQYTIDEAIADKNVLGFHVAYINTGEFKSYDSLREQLIEAIQQEQPDEAEREIERLVHSWPELEVEKQAKNRNIIAYQERPVRPCGVEDILNSWATPSQGRKFHANVAVAYKNRVITLYNEFKKQLKHYGITLKLEITFRLGNDEAAEP